MHLNTILHEVQQLHSVSGRLEVVAEEHPPVAEALITIAGTVRSAATLLEVLVATTRRGSEEEGALHYTNSRDRDEMRPL